MGKLRKRSEKVAHFFGVQEAVGSNPAVPTFKINNLRAPIRCPFSLCYTLSYSFTPIFRSIHSSTFSFCIWSHSKFGLLRARLSNDERERERVLLSWISGKDSD